MAFWLPVQILAWMKTKGFCYFYSFAEIIFGDVPALTLLCLTIERCLLLRRPATSMKTGSCRLAILLIWILTLIGWLPYVIHIEYVTSWHYPLCLVRWSAYHWHVIPVIQRSFEVIVLLVVGILCCWIFFTLNCQEEGTEIPLQITRESKTGRKLTQLTYSVGPIFALGCVPIRILILLISTMQDISVIPNLQLVSHCLNTWDYASILVLPLLYLCKHPYSRESNRPVCADEEIEIEIPFRRSI
ncbi:unnamed protein product [Allacma fusca]|uniref:G-protein coupled receptors family 1 profile domain-containing protein n=1 Tax=Allacma fusca TaxID=39272 RepID=A0A8J2JUS7_9HEXA|nr:unnamed protein product [Allacma fusca]